ncbi:MAG: porin [Rhizobiaceae bacterium]
MTLKALLMGSAAAMFAVSSANAADAVVAEPEAVEYVKVCDTYGAGFFFIPGTETCLKLSGSARIQYHYARRVNNTSTGALSYRARVNFDARNETDYGTLRSFIRIEGNGNDRGFGNSVVNIHTATISLGGLTMGFGDTFFTQNTEYGYPGNMLDGLYDYDQTIFAHYTYAANGFSGTVGIQGESNNGTDTAFDYYAGASYAGSFGRIAGTVIYDTSAGASAYSILGSLRMIEGFRLDAWYQGHNGATQYVDNGTYQWGIGAHYSITSNFGVGVGYSNAQASAGQYTIGFNWQPVSGMNVQVDYRNRRFVDSAYRIRISRSF